jgi:hypothetical protein
MTDDSSKKFGDDLPPEDKRFYSVNFLLARFAPAGDPRGERMLENKLPSRHYQSHDFATLRFYKNVSTPLSRFPPVPTDAE